MDRLPRGNAPSSHGAQSCTPRDEKTGNAALRDCALRLLSRRDHSVAELRRKLLQRGFQEDAVQEQLQRLAECGYLNDRRFAERWVESAVTSGRGFGPRLRMELQRRGIAADLAADVSARAAAAIDERDALRELISRKMPAFDPLTAPERERRRVFAFLQRRGFSSTVIIDLFRSGMGPD